MSEAKKAVIRYAGDEMFIGVSPGGHAQILDANGERNNAATPLELLMLAVGSCTAVDVISILAKQRQKVSDYRVEVTTERAADLPRYVTKFMVHHIVYGCGISSDAVARAVELSDSKYCSVAATVKPKAEVITSFEIIEDKEKT